MGEANLITIFMTGLLTGGLTCMAVQGGLLAATIAQQEQQRLVDKAKGSGKALPILAFLVAKLLAYTILGFLLGWLGSLVKLSLPVQIGMQIAVAIFMVGTALNMLSIHPVFRYFAIQPPRFLTRMVRKQSKSSSLFAPIILGAFTIFIPCGTTQAMMALAIASANPLYGAAIMFAFVLGTSPVFFLLGYLATRLGDVLQERFVKVAATAIILLAVFNLNNAMALTGSSFNFGKIVEAVNCTISFCNDGTSVAGDTLTPVSEQTITITDGGYSPNIFAVKRGSSVTLHLTNIGAQGCAQAFTVPQFGIQKIIARGSSQDVTFTAPNEQGEIAFMCSMGMYRGTIKVI